MNAAPVVATALLCVWLGHRAVAAQPEKKAPPPPNIVFILADDLGAGDLGCFNPDSKVPTPHLDKLARDGIRFTNAYCPDAVCTPSRYALMSGRYSWRSVHKAGVQGNWEKPLIEEGRLTLPALLQRAGYTTGGFGKWHIGAEFPTTDGRAPEGQGAHRHPRNGANLDLAQPLAGGPLDRGFDAWYGFICTSESLVYEGRQPVGLIDVYPAPLAAGADRLPAIPLSSYLDVVTDRSLAFIDARAADARAGRPFFLYCSPYVPHVPLAVPDAFKGRTRAGDYGDYVHALDHHVGRVFAALERHGLADNTLVVFASDNGSEFVTTGDGHRPT
ncbi:MAG TPA: sulfatase-like hydrolase/transferase, partial [Opitutaceae bacterium]